MVEIQDPLTNVNILKGKRLTMYNSYLFTIIVVQGHTVWLVDICKIPPLGLKAYTVCEVQGLTIMFPGYVFGHTGNAPRDSGAGVTKVNSRRIDDVHRGR